MVISTVNSQPGRKAMRNRLKCRIDNNILQYSILNIRKSDNGMFP